ncbi:MAG: hypothetical protein IKC43_00545 [Clostridia bacterium]|nr:hypothetical protein [Clostridia bacterium]
MVLKGCEKRVIHVKSSNNPLFEEAYFFLKHQNDTLLPPTELWREAEKIVNQSLLENVQGEKKKASNRLFYLLSFTCGALTGIGGTVFLFFV